VDSQVLTLRAAGCDTLTARDSQGSERRHSQIFDTDEAAPHMSNVAVSITAGLKPPGSTSPSAHHRGYLKIPISNMANDPA